MRRYAAPPLPGVWDRVHRIGPFPLPGVVRAILDGEPCGPVFIIRYWLKHKRRYHFECVSAYEWEIGLVRPGPVPKRIGERWPWQDERVGE